MKFGNDVLVEIMAAVQRGLLQQEDISEYLRNLDVVEKDDAVCLSDRYLQLHNRNAEEENNN